MKKKFLLCMLVAGAVVILSFTQGGLAESVKRGKVVYETNCVSCHMSEGEGLEGTFPPLAKTGRLSDKGRLVKIVFHGLSGPITVDGVEYNMEMNPVPLSDEEAADVLNYIRNSWGNKAPEIKVGEVKQLKGSK